MVFPNDNSPFPPPPESHLEVLLRESLEERPDRLLLALEGPVVGQVGRAGGGLGTGRGGLLLALGLWRGRGGPGWKKNVFK